MRRGAPICVFTGPTLAAADARAVLDAIYLPPAAHGDVYRATRARPAAIAIIDGYFERVPSVWHKEILFALAEGVHVFGAASMGALRAAELAQFGMEGVGEIFAAFRRGDLTDDDEVAVVHGDAASGYRPLSEAMVNLRATLGAAARARVIRPAARDALVAAAKRRFYPARTWPALLEDARAALPARELDRLRAWLPSGRVDRKRLDALALLRVLRRRRASLATPRRVRWTFELTSTWDQFTSGAGRATPTRAARDPAARSGRSRGRAREGREDAEPGAPDDPAERDALLEELGIAGDRGAGDGALLRALALEEARRLGARPAPERVAEAADALRREHGLLTPAAAERWIAEQGLDRAAFDRLAGDEARLRWVRSIYEPEAGFCLPDHLRARGDYGRLEARARDKQRALAARGLAEPTLADAGLDEPALWRWYFEERLGRPVPPALDAHARAHGFPDLDALRRAALRERCYVALGAATPRPRRPAPHR